MFLVGEMSSIKNEPSDSFWFQGTNQARRGSRKRPDPSSSDATGRDLPRPGLGPDHDQDDPSQGRDVQIGRETVFRFQPTPWWSYPACS
jgi:hypothetical protein